MPDLPELPPALLEPAACGWWTPPPGASGDWQLWPGRVVDAHFRGWYSQGGTPPGTYTAAFNRQPRMSYHDIDTGRGPVRHVIPAPAADIDALVSVLTGARTHAVGSVLVAAYRLYRGPEIPGLDRESTQARTRSIDACYHAMSAGREGSWETQRLYQLAWSAGCDIADKPRRFDESAAEAVIAVVQRWTGGMPRFYVEVAANLCAVFAQVIDANGGWDAVCDLPLRASARLPQRDAESIRAFFHRPDQWHDDAAPVGDGPVPLAGAAGDAP